MSVESRLGLGKARNMMGMGVMAWMERNAVYKALMTLALGFFLGREREGTDEGEGSVGAVREEERAMREELKERLLKKVRFGS